jgi:hypothetical protein
MPGSNLLGTACFLMLVPLLGMLEPNVAILAKVLLKGGVCNQVMIVQTFG